MRTTVILLLFFYGALRFPKRASRRTISPELSTSHHPGIFMRCPCLSKTSNTTSPISALAWVQKSIMPTIPRTAQRFSLVWYRNKAVGNGLLLYSQFIWRPDLVNDSFGELKAGLGYLISQRPVDSYQQVNGSWTPVGKKRKGYVDHTTGPRIWGPIVTRTTGSMRPSSATSFLAVTGYSQSMPVIPETLIQGGTQIQTNQ